MNAELNKLLEYCEQIINLKEIEKKHARAINSLTFKDVDMPCVKISYPHPKFKKYSMEEIHQDIEKMMYNELVDCLPQIEVADGGLPTIRANYGVGILPSVFGAKCKIINGNMPWVNELSKKELSSIISAGVPDYKQGFGQKVIDTYAFFAEKLKNYPKCSKVIKFYHPDYQGAFDVAHLLFGSDIYMELYDDPDFVNDLMQLITQTYIYSMNKVKPYLNDEIQGFVYHWGHLFPGKIVLRNDSAVNLSKDMFEEFVIPYDTRIAQEFGGASVHFCGRADQWVFELAKEENVLGYNCGHMPNVVFGQEYLDFIKPAFYDKNKPNVAYTLTRNDVENFDFKKYKTGLTYNLWASNKEDAEKLIERIREKSN